VQCQATGIDQIRQSEQSTYLYSIWTAVGVQISYRSKLVSLPAIHRDRTDQVFWKHLQTLSISTLDLLFSTATAMSIEVKVDNVISHTCPKSFDVLGATEKYHDSNRKPLDQILEKYRPELWFFGHWHKHQSTVPIMEQGGVVLIIQAMAGSGGPGCSEMSSKCLICEQETLKHMHNQTHGI
jgi:hypothetical protein